MAWQRLTLGIVLLLFVLIAWLGRYHVVGVGSEGVANRLDRWTGQVVYMSLGFSGNVSMPTE